MQKALAAMSLAGVALLAACAPKDASQQDTARIAQSGGAGSRATFDAATHTATVYAKDYAFEAPDSIPAGLTTFHLVNEGPGLHHVQLVRLDSGKTAADLDAAMKTAPALPAWAVLVGGPNAPAPGNVFDSSLDLAPGNYVMLCVVDIPDNVPHFAKGMVHPFRVTAATGAPAAAPTPDVTITLADYNFAIKGSLTAGKHVVQILNDGPQDHEVEFFQLAPGKTLADLQAWIQTRQGPPPGMPIGGVAGTARSTTSFITLDLTPGEYVMVCFVPDSKDGKPHTAHGMVKPFTVS